MIRFIHINSLAISSHSSRLLAWQIVLKSAMRNWMWGPFKLLIRNISWESIFWIRNIPKWFSFLKFCAYENWILFNREEGDTREAEQSSKSILNLTEVASCERRNIFCSNVSQGDKVAAFSFPIFTFYYYFFYLTSFPSTFFYFLFSSALFLFSSIFYFRKERGGFSAL